MPADDAPRTRSNGANPPISCWTKLRLRSLAALPQTSDDVLLGRVDNRDLTG